MSAAGKTLGEFARNVDGETYDGRKVAQWLFHALTGKDMSDSEAEALVADAKRRAAEKATGR